MTTGLSTDQARSILQALRDGQVPANGVSRLCIGREPIIEGYRKLLKDITNGQAAMKFIKGDYGYGKSMLLRVFEEIAHEKNFAVAKISIRSELPFNKVEEFYRKIAREICTAGGQEGIGGLLQRWVKYIRREVCNKAGAPDDPIDLNEAIYDKGRKQLQEVRNASPAFAQGVEAYLKGVLRSNRQIVDAAVAWLRQDPAQRAEDKRLIGVKGNLAKENAIEFLQALLRFVRWVPLAGTVILVDEAEYMRNLSQQRLRNAAYDNIRALWDDCNHRELKYTLFVFAATTEMFSDVRRGFPSYQALVDRMGLDQADEVEANLDMRWPIVELPLLDVEQAVELSRRLVHLHARAEGWDGNARIGDDLLEQVAEQAGGGLLGGGIRPREFVRSVIRWLDRVQARPESPKSDYLGLFSNTLQETREEEEDEEPLWVE